LDGSKGGVFTKTGGVIYGDSDNIYDETDPDNNTNIHRSSEDAFYGHAVATTNQKWKRNSTVGVKEALSYDGSTGGGEWDVHP
jgi:hypothetical protein